MIFSQTSRNQHNRLTYLQCKFPKLEILDVSHNLFEHLDHLGGPYTSLMKLNISSNMLSSIGKYWFLIRQIAHPASESVALATVIRLNNEKRI